MEANEQPRPLTIRVNTLKTRVCSFSLVFVKNLEKGPCTSTNFKRRQLRSSWWLDKSGFSSLWFASSHWYCLWYDCTFILLGATPEYLAGHYMLQSASSFLPVIALSPQVTLTFHCHLIFSARRENTWHVRSTWWQDNSHRFFPFVHIGGFNQIAALMKNSGILVANDSNAERAKALVANLQRMVFIPFSLAYYLKGVQNSIVCTVDGREFPRVR